MQFRREALDHAIVGHHVEQIAFAEVVEHKLQRPLGLLDLLAAHAARAIDHEHERLRWLFGVRRLYLRRGQQQQRAVFARVGAIGQYAGADRLAANVEHQPKIAGRNLVLAGVGDHRLLVARTLDLDLVRRAVDVLDVRLAVDVEGEADRLDRLGGVLGRAQREQEIGQPAIGAAELGVAERHLPLRPRRQREDARLEHARAHPFQQRRVLILPHDRLIRAAGLLGVEQLGLVFLAVDHQCQPADRPVIGQREHENHFHLPAARVDERLGDLHLGDLIGQRNAYVELFDFVGVGRGHGPGNRPWAGPDDRRPGQPHLAVRGDVDQ